MRYADFETSINAAHDYYDDCEGEDDDAMRDRLREAIEGIIDHGARLLSQAGFVASKPEQYITVNLPGVAVPVIGFIDLQTTSTGLKTADPKRPEEDARPERRLARLGQGDTA